MMESLGYSMLYYWAAYLIVTLIGVLHTWYNIAVLKMSPMDDQSMGEGYEKTKPFHVLYNIAVFPLFAYFYISGLDGCTITDVIFTSLIWGFVTVVVDWIGWVMVKHPWSLSAKVFYIDYQPWISLIYLVIFAAPFVAYLFL